MQLEIDPGKRIRPVHECYHVDCENMVYGPVPTRESPTTIPYECDACGESYLVWRKNWPKYDVSFIIS